MSGHGDTGKTFLWTPIITALWADDHIVLAIASSGVASLLLLGGRTAHSWFRILNEIDERTMWSIPRGTNLAKLIEKATLILWDEALMTHNRCFQAFLEYQGYSFSVIDSSRSLLPSGGKTMVLGGDFGQVLPVVKGGNRGEILDSSLIKSPLWQHVTVLRLRKNMRLSNPELSVDGRADLETFAQWVLSVGDGTMPMDTRLREASLSWISLPPDITLLPDYDYVSAIVDGIYEPFSERYLDASYLAERAIVCPTNKVADSINDVVSSRVPGDAMVFESCGTISTTMDHIADVDLLYPLEFLHEVDPSNFPQHKILLKVGVPIMLLRNINQSFRLCNESASYKQLGFVAILMLSAGIILGSITRQQVVGSFLAEKLLLLAIPVQLPIF